MEILCAINTDVEDSKTAWVTVDAEIHALDDSVVAVYEAGRPLSGQVVATTIRVVGFGERRAVEIMVPPAGFVVYKKL